MKSWTLPVALVLAVQTATTAIEVAVPVLGPVITSAAGVPPESVGYVSSIVALGSVLFFLFGSWVIRVFGPVRVLQLGATASAVALLFALAESWWLLLLGALILGVGFGTNTPCGAVILRAWVPQSAGNFAFSVKQAGVPLGAIAAGIGLPALAGVWSWQGALISVACIAITVAAIGQLVRVKIESRVRSIDDKSLTPGLGLAGLASHLRRPRIARLCAAGVLFAMVQGSFYTFLVTFLFDAIDYPLAFAGIMYSFASVTGIAGRIGAGWIADRVLGGVRTMSALGIATGLSVGVFTTFDPASAELAVVLGVAFAGLVVGSWNGVYLAVAAYEAPPGRVAELSSVTAIAAFVGFLVGPIVFAEAVSITGGYQASFVLMGLAAVVGAAILPRGST